MRTVGKLCLILVCLAFWTGTVRSETVDRIVAVVNGDIILYSELQAKIQVLEKVSPETKPSDPGAKEQLEREVLLNMVREKLAEQEVKRLKITVGEREVDDYINAIKKENNFTDSQFEYVIQQSGQTMVQFREATRKDLERSRLVERVLKSKTVITDEQVDAFLKSGKLNVSDSKDRRRLAIIFLPISEGAQEKNVEEAEKLARDIHGRLRGGTDFAKLAREYSKGPAAEDGGDIGYIAADELAPYIESAIRGLKANETTDVVKAPNGYYIVKILDVQKEKQDSTDSSLREKARRQLFQNEVTRKFEEWVRDLESRAFIQLSL